MGSSEKDFEYALECLNEIRRIKDKINEDTTSAYKYFLNEGVEQSNNDAVPYSREDELLSSIMETAKTQFGADFSKYKHPMLYYPKDGDITLSGDVSDLNGVKFQFRYKDSSGNGCYLFIDSKGNDGNGSSSSFIQLSDETIKKLNIINGVFKNWKRSLASAEDIKPMSLKNDNDNMVPGDDID